MTLDCPGTLRVIVRALVRGTQEGKGQGDFRRLLLALNLEEGATGQGVQVTSGSRKSPSALETADRAKH